MDLLIKATAETLAKELGKEQSGGGLRVGTPSPAFQRAHPTTLPSADLPLASAVVDTASTDVGDRCHWSSSSRSQPTVRHTTRTDLEVLPPKFLIDLQRNYGQETYEAVASDYLNRLARYVK